MNQTELKVSDQAVNRSPEMSETGEHERRSILDSLKRISWSSIIAGVLIAVVIQIALSLLGIGIGLSTVDPKIERNPVAGLGIGSAVWYGISSLLALFAGGWIAGRLAPVRRVFDSVIHGLVAWSLITLITLYFVTTTLGSILGGVSRMVGNTLGIVGNIAVAGKPAGNTPGNVAANAQQAYNEAAVEWEKNKQENETRARVLADQTAKAASTAAILTFVSLVLGAAVAGYGARRGAFSIENSRSTDQAAFAG